MFLLSSEQNVCKLSLYLQQIAADRCQDQTRDDDSVKEKVFFSFLILCAVMIILYKYDLTGY